MLLKPKKRLGQHFLNSSVILQGMIDALPSVPLNVIEIGPGTGVLTKALIEAGHHVVAIETDRDLQQHLDPLNGPSCQIVYGDFLETDLQSLTDRFQENRPLWVVANIPYYISTPIIKRVLSSASVTNTMIMVQQEWAQRLYASPRTSAYGSLSVFVQSQAEVVPLMSVSKRNFNPQPQVDSEIIIVKRKEIKWDLSEFHRFIARCFLHKRKQLTNSLKGFYETFKVTAALTAMEKSPNIRAEELSVEDFFKLYELLVA